MIFWFLFAVCILVEIVCVPWYLKALWPEKCTKSLVLKMVCATGFVGIGVLSMFISNNFSPYAITMLVGLVLGWVGDYFLHAKPTNAYFVTGFLSFLLGHVGYIIAYAKATPVIAPQYKLFSIAEIAAIIGIVALIMIFSKIIKVKFAPKPVKYAIVLYLLVINTMLVRAIALGWSFYKTGAEYGVVALVLLALGSVFFLLSDVTLGIIAFGGQKKNYPLKIFNILTYFWGQVMLASSILFINA